MHFNRDYDFAIHAMSRFYLYSLGMILGGFNFIIHFGYVAMRLSFVAAHHRTTVNIYMRRTKTQNLNHYRLVLQLSLPNPLKPGV